MAWIIDAKMYNMGELSLLIIVIIVIVEKVSFTVLFLSLELTSKKGSVHGKTGWSHRLKDEAALRIYQVILICFYGTFRSACGCDFGSNLVSSLNGFSDYLMWFVYFVLLLLFTATTH